MNKGVDSTKCVLIVGENGRIQCRRDAAFGMYGGTASAVAASSPGSKGFSPWNIWWFSFT